MSIELIRNLKDDLLTQLCDKYCLDKGVGKYPESTFGCVPRVTRPHGYSRFYNKYFESIRNETQPGRRTNTVLQDGDGSGPIKCGGVHYATDNEGPKARTKTKSTRKKGTRKSRKK